MLPLPNTITITIIIITAAATAAKPSVALYPSVLVIIGNEFQKAGKKVKERERERYSNKISRRESTRMCRLVSLAIISNCVLLISNYVSIAACLRNEAHHILSFMYE